MPEPVDGVVAHPARLVPIYVGESEHACGAKIQVDAVGIITAWTASAEAMFGWPRSEVEGRSLPEVVLSAHEGHFTRARMLQQILACVEGQADAPMSFPIRRRAGNESRVEMHLTRESIGQRGLVSAFLFELPSSCEARQRHQMILQGALDAVISMDASGLVTAWNRQAESIFGWSEAEVTGRRLSDLIVPPQHREAHEHGLRRFLATGERKIANRRIEITAMRRNGEEFPIELTIIPILTGEAYSFCAFLRDVTEHKRAETALRESESRHRAILDGALDAVLTMDAQGLITEWSGQASAIFGWSRAEVLGRLLSSVIVPPQHREAHERGFRRFLATGEKHILGRRIEITALRRNGQEFPIELTITALSSAQGAAFSAFVRDITERRRAEAEVRAREAAEEANRAKSAFIANMSHELRTPLNAIIGYSEMLSEEAADLGQDSFIKDLGRIHTAGKHLLSLINSILDLSKIESGKMELYLETIAIADMTRDVVAIVQPLAEKNANRLEVSCSENLGQMFADLTRTRQCLFNLLSNACKFTDHGTIRLDVARVARKGEEWVRFEVRDSGIGMTDEQMAKLFQAFTQADASTTRKYGGTGLGLAISRKFCQMMGGDIQVASEINRGSAFTMEIPARVRDPKEEPEDADATMELPASTASGVSPDLGQKILVIDDDPVVRDLMQRALAREGFHMIAAAGGQEGLKLARTHLPAAILLDVSMPGMDGWAVLSELKADSELASIPVIMATMFDQQNLAFALGVSDYLTKPVDRAHLARVLRKFCCAHPPCRVLIVEDDPGIREMMCRMIEREGWEAVAAENGRVGLDRLAECRPALVLLDLMMPEMDGFEFIRRLQERECWRTLPVVVVTAKDLTDEDRSVLQGNVQKILQKGSYGVEDLVREIERQVQRGTKPS